jgi:hypothetical protein
MKISNEKGNAAIILCLVVTALFGFMAYVADIGIVYIEKTRLSDAIDASILAASMELPDNKENAKQTAIEYLEKNNVDPNKAAITISPDGKRIQIDGTSYVKHLFAPMVGISGSNVKASATAILAPIKSVTGGVRPFAVESYNFCYGDLVTLKNGAGNGYNGNYGVVDLGGGGASTYKANALYGYNGTISVGNYIDTEPGDMSGATNEIIKYINTESSTFDNFPRNSIRLWILPIVDSLEVNGSSQVHIIGLGEFYVEGVGNNSGKMEIRGRFLRYVTKGETDMTIDDTGAYGVKLIN